MADDTKARQTAQDMKEAVRDEAARTGETIRGEAEALAAEAGTVGRAHAEQRFEQGKGAVEDQVDTLHSAIDGAARRLREENSPLASYADELSGQLARFSDGIENSSLDDLAVKTRRVARENPGLFVLGSVVAGIAAGRFFKASSSRDDYVGDDERDVYGQGDDHARNDHGSEGYRAGREAAMARYRTEHDYRSPLARDPAPRRPQGPGTGATGTTARVPMDSTASAGTVPAAGTTPTTSAAATSAGATNPNGGH